MVVFFREAFSIHPSVPSSIHLKLYEANKTLPAEMPYWFNQLQEFPFIRPSVRPSSIRDGIIQGRQPWQMSPKRQGKVRFPFILTWKYFRQRLWVIYCNLLSYFTFFGRSFTSAFLDQFRTRFQRESVGTFEHPVSLTFTPQNCGFHGFDFRVRWIPAAISPWASLLLFSVYYRATPCCTIIIPCLTYDNCGGCRSIQRLPTFLWTVLPLGSHSRNVDMNAWIVQLQFCCHFFPSIQGVWQDHNISLVSWHLDLRWV